MPALISPRTTTSTTTMVPNASEGFRGHLTSTQPLSTRREAPRFQASGRQSIPSVHANSGLGRLVIQGPEGREGRASCVYNWTSKFKTRITRPCSMDEQGAQHVFVSMVSLCGMICTRPIAPQNTEHKVHDVSLRKYNPSRPKYNQSCSIVHVFICVLTSTSCPVSCQVLPLVIKSQSMRYFHTALIVHRL